ncbi:hypothetical protein Q7P37_009671 [Cladosporium fusiforme]
MRFDTGVLFLVSVTIFVATKQFSGLRCDEHYLALLLAGSLLFATYRTYIYPNFFSPLRHIPQPSGALPFIGHDLAAFQQPPAKDFGRWMREVDNDGLIRFRGLFGCDRLLVTNAKAISEVLVTRAYDLQKPSALSELCRKFIGTGLITAEGDEHKRLRKDTSPAFAFRRVKNLYPIFWAVSSQLTDGVAKQLERKESSVVETNHWANLATTDIIGLAAMGKDFRSLEQGHDHPLVASFEEITDPSTEKIIYFALNMLGLSNVVRWLPWRMNKIADSISDNLHDICSNLVNEKQKQISTSEADAHKDILSHLITSTSLTHDQLVDQLLTILSAGHGTTSVTFTWMTYLLAKNPDIQERLRAEIHQHVPSPSKPILGDDLASVLQSLPLLNGVCNETLRLFPAINIIYRNTVRPTVLLGNLVPAGVQVILSPWAINRNKSLWGSDAEEFRPERWIDVDSKTGAQKANNSGGAESNYANLTFLHGPRSCIGHSFATAELRCLAAAFVGKFEFEMADPDEVVIPYVTDSLAMIVLKIVHVLTLLLYRYGNLGAKPKNGMRLRMKPAAAW